VSRGPGTGGSGAGSPPAGLLAGDGAIERVLAEALGEVEAIFAKQLASDLPAVNELCRHVERYRGKRLRPTLLLLSGLAAAGGDAARGCGERHRRLAAVVEMIHVATLVHDDVLDEAEVRRSAPTVNRLRGNETAVMLGDYLISNAFHLCSSLGDPSLNLAIGEVTNTVCEGELLQLHHRDDLSIGEELYLAIVRRKTASLVGVCGRLGAVLAGGDAAVAEALARYGTAAGIAFQIQDDLLDLQGSAAVVGKSIGRDLEKGKITLPALLHLAAAPPQERSEILDAFAARDASRLRERLEQGGAIARSRQRAAEFVADAKASLRGLPACEARDLLDRLADAVLAREA
jgi:octaprenyl-diphosphate synthase